MERHPWLNRPLEAIVIGVDPDRALRRSAVMRSWVLPVAVAGLVGCGVPAREGPTNLLLLVLDTTRADTIGAYGATDTFTPMIDSLAADGVLFGAARATSAWTVPTHGSLFTGLYPSRHGAHWESPILPEDRVTLAEVLRTTHATGGFSENPHIVSAKGFAQGFERYEETWRNQRSWHEPPITLDLFEDWLARRDPSRPFFAFLNLMTPHLPYTPPPEHAKRFLPAGTTLSEMLAMMRVGEVHARRYMSGALHFTRRQLAILRALYRAEVSFADARVGRVLERLRADGELDRTLIVIVGDHGENIGEHGLMEHQLCLYESLLRVPLVLRLPGRLDGGVRRDAPVQLVDVVPTVLEALSVPREHWPPLEGVSLLGTDPPAERPLIAEYMRPLEQRRLFARAAPGFDFEPYDRRLKSIQVGRLKLIASDRGDSELYDLAEDPDERRDLAATRPHDVARLRARLDAWSGGSFAPREIGQPALDAETRRALRELGYVE